MHKWIRVGTSKSLEHVSVYVEIEWDGKRLSICGVEGPTANGNARGDPADIVVHRHGRLDAIDVIKLRDVWARWHLNDMRAGCEHQRADVEWNVSEEIEIVAFKLTSEACSEQRHLKDICEAALKNGETVKLTEEQRGLYALPFTTTLMPDADSAASGRYEVDKREMKRAGRVSQEEHPRGLLSKACPICGYAYGTAWLHEDVPADVVAWLESLPSCPAPKGWG